MRGLRIYELNKILPLYKSYERIVVQPAYSRHEELIVHEKSDCKDETHDSDEQSIETLHIDDSINSFLDNDDIDFVMRNIENGKEAEDYVQRLILKTFNNCIKVKAREGYDFKVTTKEKEIKIEVKSIQSYNAPFHMTINEIDHAIHYADEYYICFVILPSLVKGVNDIRFLCDPIRNLGIKVLDRKYEGIGNNCVIMPEKFLIKPAIGLVKKLPQTLK